MKKNILAVTAVLIVCTILFGAAQAGDVDNLTLDNILRIDLRSGEAVELHIGLIEARLADNYPLEMAFLKQYPNGKIVYHLLNAEQLSAYLLSNESTLDLLILQNTLTNDFAVQGAFVDFYDTDLFSAWPKDWIDVQKQAETDGRLFGFPKSIDQNFLGWNKPLAQRVGADKPSLIWTWDDYLELCQTLPYDLDGDAQKDFLLMRGNYHVSGLSGFVNDFFEQYAYQYALKGGSFLAPEFEKLVRLFMDILASKALGNWEEAVPVFEGEDAVLLTAFSGDCDDVLSETRHAFLPYPVLNWEDPGYAGLFYTYSLLKNAPHQALAIDFLKNAFHSDVQSMAVGLNQVFTRTLPKYIIVNEGTSLYDAFAPDANGAMTYSVAGEGGYAIYPLDERLGEISPEVFEAYQFMREYLLPYNSQWVEISILWFEMFEQYQSGALPLPEVLRAMDARMAMMQGE